jgi:hypothetical protein
MIYIHTGTAINPISNDVPLVLLLLMFKQWRISIDLRLSTNQFQGT